MNFKDLLILYYDYGLTKRDLSKNYPVSESNLSRVLRREDVIKYYEDHCHDR